jgi:ubiquinone/menaquinone biosynthesis C-methylase UbiE
VLVDDPLSPPSSPNPPHTAPPLPNRADVGRLPFASGSVSAIHAAAAIHCWPNPQAALAEISRVLKPGGVFVASTFLVASAPLGQLLGNDDIVRPLAQADPTLLTGAQAQFRWWEEQELRDLCSSVGLEGFTRERSWRFIMFSVRKPAGVSTSSA